MHTPGPWRNSETFGHGVSIATDDERLYIGNADSADVSEEQRRANARLMAAAPELLEALVESLEIIREHNPKDPSLEQFDECPIDHPNCCGFCAIKFQMKAAIAKATGA